MRPRTTHVEHKPLCRYAPPTCHNAGEAGGLDGGSYVHQVIDNVTRTFLNLQPKRSCDQQLTTSQLPYTQAKAGMGMAHDAASQNMVRLLFPDRVCTRPGATGMITVQ